MAKNKSDEKQETRSSLTFPWLNQAVADAVADDISSVWFNKKPKEKPSNEYSTNVRARFWCRNKLCSKHHRGWSSGKVAIVIKGYVDNGYQAVVFNQRCDCCKQLGTMTLDEQTYVERVAYRLKKWAGVANLETPPYVQKGMPPHKSELCEGCKRGVCEKDRRRHLYSEPVSGVL